MKLHLSLDSQSALSPFPFLTYVFHVTFFWIRVAGFIAIFGLRGRLLDAEHIVTSPASHKSLSSIPVTDVYNIPDDVPPEVFAKGLVNGILETSNDFVFLVSFNIFQLYLELQSFTSGNIYGYYMAIVVMIHNSVLTMFIPSTTSLPVYFEYWIVFSIISGAFVLEALITIYTIYLRRYESSLDIFRKVGANPRINTAFTTRKILQTFGMINMFFALCLGCKDFVIPSTRFTQPATIRFSYIVVTCIQQLFISINFHDEDFVQRKIAIYISLFKILLIIGAIVWTKVAGPPRLGISNSVEIFVLADALAVSVITTWFLINDTKQFGSGVKEYLIFRTKKLDLSSSNVNKG